MSSRWQHRYSVLTLSLAAQIIVMTGGESFLTESVQSAWLSCEPLDVISIHAYGPGDLTTSALEPFVTQAVNTGKKLIMEEWYVALPQPRLTVLRDAAATGVHATTTHPTTTAPLATCWISQRAMRTSRTSRRRSPVPVSRGSTGKSSPMQTRTYVIRTN